jgi:hypothetical protein
MTAFRDHWVAYAMLPGYVIADNELGITGGEMREFCDTYGIIIKNSLPWNPTGNSIAETAVRIVKNALRSFCIANDCTSHWHNYLWLICNQINALVSRSTNTSAELLLFHSTTLNLKTHPILLAHNKLNLPSFFKDENTKIAIEAVNQQFNLEPQLREDMAQEIPDNPPDTLTLIEHVCNQRDKIRAQNMGQRNKSSGPEPFRINQLVLLKVMTKATATGVPFALQSRFTGPYIITHIGHDIANLRHCLQGHQRISSVKYLKPYLVNNYDYQMPPNWNGDLLQLSAQESRRSDRLAEKQKTIPPAQSEKTTIDNTAQSDTTTTIPPVQPDENYDDQEDKENKEKSDVPRKPVIIKFTKS